MALKPFFDIPSEKSRKKKGVMIDYDKPGDPYCNLCGLNKTAKSWKIPVTGKGKKGILCWAEAPGETEDIKNQNLVGEAGEAFENMLSPFGINLHRDCYIINTVNCRPPQNRPPKSDEIQYCRPYILKEIERIKPKHIWLLGTTATDSFFIDNFGTRNITRFRKWAIPDRQFNCWVVPLYHPSNLLRRSKDENFLSNYKRDLQFAIYQLDIPFPKPLDWYDHIKNLFHVGEIVSRLKYILDRKPHITFDYETTGLKPFKPNHRIRIIGVDDGESSTAFPYMDKIHSLEDFKIIKELWTKILIDPKIIKTAHNMGFEDMWSRVMFDLPKIEGWKGCTMNNAHILDERKKANGLKFQIYVRFGMVGYDKNIEHYLKTTEEYNNIYDCPLDELLTYCNIDCIGTRELDKVQDYLFEKVPELKEGRYLFHIGKLALNNMQIRGIGSDEKYYKEEQERIGLLIDRLTRQITEGEEGQRFRKNTGKSININSPKDLKLLLFKILGYESIKKTEKGNESVDESVLQKMDHPICKKILKLKKLEKINGTYLKNFIKETHEGRMHPFFELHKARTYRSSSNKFNFQNIPKRDKLAEKTCRSGIVPSPGNRLIEPDYSSMEVRIAACLTEDPVLIDYVKDKKSDMHRDCASELFLLEKERVDGKVRFFSKNNWVFPELYLSWYEACAMNLWENVVKAGLTTTDDITIKEHLRSKNILNISQFIDHCKRYEAEYWDRFKGVKQWQNKVVKTYLEKGYVSMPTGFRRRGWLTRNEIVNTPIQGSAFHCLLWTAAKTDEVSMYEEWETLIVGQIHDSMEADTPPYEQKMVCDTIETIGTKDIIEHWPWIIVPLEMEFEFTPIDGSWYEKEEVYFDYDLNEWVGKKSKEIYDENY